MSTHSAIIMKTENGYIGIYCHFDGHIQSVGKRLHVFYNDTEMVEDLITLGDISSLGQTLSDTIAFHRDRQEDLHSVIGETLEEVEERMSFCDYSYVYDGHWTVNGKSLAAILEDIWRLS